MSQQGSLFDFEPPPKNTDRLFFAVMPDQAAVASIRALTTELKTRHGMTGRPIDESKLHATLCVLGDFAGMPDALIKSASKAAALVADSTLPFKAGFDTVQTFITGPRHRPLVLTGGDGVVGLTGFYKNLSGALLKTSGLRNPHSYTPHVTLLYDDVTLGPQSVAPIEWTVRELVLLHSHIGQGRPYTILARWSF
ncbi:2'-5' RNA ligase [Duganella sp. SG902]|uniref:2'-5' RNA ligase family protein n=1 Tax=Duganella sp. SG902 TaxID=2587016 RepID=UPI00159E90F3|nr:2'-5' RNA ligase family protein [Duganella sp. SG902]NVM78255.1 2'-5' RNA ligase [Duganella sp. SG902]